jgi:hypothetical protein
MVDPSRGSSEIVLKLKTQMSYSYKKLNVQVSKLKISSDEAGKGVISFIKIQWEPLEDWPFSGIHTLSLYNNPSP